MDWICPDFDCSVDFVISVIRAGEEEIGQFPCLKRCPVIKGILDIERN
jgi:hypothetical protein